MSYENPTALQVGTSGTLNGWRVRVAGRVVMGMQDGGETYYWSEYYLVDDSGNSANLVYEETEAGPEWKLFREFTPSTPLNAREAASKRVGDNVNLDGASLPITLVGASRVFHIEGSAPEGVEEGDIASYFNVDTGTRMLVTSWTGDEVEFYEGLDAPADSVAAAFGLTPPTQSSTAGFASNLADGGAARRRTSLIVKIVVGVFLLTSGLLVYAFFPLRMNVRPATSAAPKALPRQAVPPLALLNNARGGLAQQDVLVRGHTVHEIARVSGTHDHREYHLDGDEPNAFLLVNGLSGGSKEWHLLKKVKGPLPVLGPFEAAMKRKGTSVNVDGQILRIVDLFQSRTLLATGPGVPGQPDDIQYGFVAKDGTDWLIARWNEKQIQFLRGSSIPETEVLAAFPTNVSQAR